MSTPVIRMSSRATSDCWEEETLWCVLARYEPSADELYISLEVDLFSLIDSNRSLTADSMYLEMLCMRLGSNGDNTSFVTMPGGKFCTSPLELT